MSRIRKIINLVDGVSPVNFGIWHAAVATSSALSNDYGIESYLVSPTIDISFQQDHFPAIKTIQLESVSKEAAITFFKAFNPEETIVASHGCWRFATKWAALAQHLGFTWVYTPHGMLEPWSMEQKRWKKLPYFYLIERRLARKANLIRAVGKPEMENLNKHFQKVIHIPNGIYQSELKQSHKNEGPPVFLFLARLHHKKGIIPLVSAWCSSEIIRNSGARLEIAGTDDGEKDALESIITQNPDKNIRFLGPVFGKAKEELMGNAHFYVLPSLSEGFPTSVVEAIGAGLLPLISEGCNFPEILSEGAAINTGTSISSIQEALEKAIGLEQKELDLMRQKGLKMVKESLIWEKIAGAQVLAFEPLLAQSKKI